MRRLHQQIRSERSVAHSNQPTPAGLILWLTALPSNQMTEIEYRRSQGWVFGGPLVVKDCKTFEVSLKFVKRYYYLRELTILSDLSLWSIL